MKILMVNNFFRPFGGGEICMMTLARLLEQNGHTVEYFAMDCGPFLIPDYPHTDLFAQYTAFSKVSKLQQLGQILKLRPIYNFEARQKLDQLIERIQPDFVHYHAFNSYLTSSVLQPCIKRGIPFLKTLHGAEWMCPSGNLYFKDSAGYCSSELCVRSHQPYHCLVNKCADGSALRSLIRTIQSYGEKIHRHYHQVPLFICPSQAMYDLGRRFGIPKEKLIVINNILDPRYFAIEPVYDNDGYFLYVGRLDREKGLMDLLEVARACPEIPFRIVGTGRIEGEMRAFIETYALQNVQMVGFCTGPALDAQYKRCIATVLPCNWFETFGMTILESFAYGKPVIASHIGAIPELVQSDVTGYTFTAGDTQALQAAIEKLFNNADSVEQMGRSGRLKFEYVSDPQRHYEQMMAIYTQMIHAYKTSHPKQFAQAV